MKVQEILTFVMERLAEEVVDLSPEEVIVVAVPTPDPAMGRRHVQVYDGGSNTSMEGGGNLARRISIGVRVYQRLSVDKFASLQAAGLNLQDLGRKMVKVLHLRYDVEQVPLQEPIFLESTAPVRMVIDGETRLLMLDLTFRVLFVMTDAEVKEYEA